jgi:hypothetical protein
MFREEVSGLQFLVSGSLGGRFPSMAAIKQKI